MTDWVDVLGVVGMTTEEAKRLVDEAFENSAVIKEWRELAKRERVEQAKLLRIAVEASARAWAYSVSEYTDAGDVAAAEKRANEEWQAYYDSL